MDWIVPYANQKNSPIEPCTFKPLLSCIFSLQHIISGGQPESSRSTNYDTQANPNDRLAFRHFDAQDLQYFSTVWMPGNAMDHPTNDDIRKKETGYY